LQACIKEALRFWPPVVGLLQKLVPPEGDTIDGKFLPGGTLISQSAWGVARDPLVYNPDPNIFRPERWLDSPPDKLREMERQSELTFGYGRSKCLGQPIAMMELNKVFVELFRRFDFEVINPGEPWYSASSGIFLQKNFWVKVTERAH
jgi:cytochrome P450